MKTTREERAVLRREISSIPPGHGPTAAVLRLLDDADRCEALEGLSVFARAIAGTAVNHAENQAERISTLESALRKVDEIREEMSSTDQEHWWQSLGDYLDAIKSACAEVNNV